MRLTTVLPFLVAIAGSALVPAYSRAATIQYDFSGNYLFDSLEPGIPLTGTFDWNTSTGLGNWNIDLAEFPAGTLSDGPGGQGSVTGSGFQFVQTDVYDFGSQQFTIAATFKGVLPTTPGGHTKFSGTFVDDIFLTGSPTFENVFTVSGTIWAACIDPPVTATPEPASLALAGVGAIALCWFGKRRFTTTRAAGL